MKKMNRKGIALVMIIGISFVLMIVIAVSFSFLESNYLFFQKMGNKTDDFYLVEAGIERALNKIHLNNTNNETFYFDGENITITFVPLVGGVFNITSSAPSGLFIRAYTSGGGSTDLVNYTAQR